VVIPERKLKGQIDNAEWSFSNGISYESRGAGKFDDNNGYAEFCIDFRTGPIQLLIINLNRVD